MATKTVKNMKHVLANKNLLKRLSISQAAAYNMCEQMDVFYILYQLYFQLTQKIHNLDLLYLFASHCEE